MNKYELHPVPVLRLMVLTPASSCLHLASGLVLKQGDMSKLP